MSLTLRFDLRAPSGGVGDLYAAALDMTAWAEEHGAGLVVLSEHHGADDGHLPSPVVLAAALAARTRRVRILLAALVLPLHDPVRLAEDLSLLDILSSGRVSCVLGVGHREEEYAHAGGDWSRRGATADAHLALLQQLLAGEQVGPTRVTPQPLTPGGPALMVGGGSRAAVRRAARHGLGFLGQTADPGLREAYAEECARAGKAPRFVHLPTPGEPTVVFVADDVDAAWAELGPHLLHDAVSAAAWRAGDSRTASISHARSVSELRAGTTHRVLTTAEAVGRLREGGSLPLAPLCGGLPPALAWPYLRAAAAAAALAVRGEVALA